MALHLGLGLVTLILASWLALSAAQSQERIGRSALPAQPADHLVPPPLPIPQRLTHAGAGSPSAVAPSVAPVAPVATPEATGFMTRVARWFGLGGGGSSPKDQQLGASNSLSYAYPKPAAGGFDAGGKPCSLCNKYPWVPMVGQQQQLHPQQLNSQLQVQQQQLQHLPQQQQQQHHPQQQQQQLLQHPQQQHATWQQQQPLAQASQQRQRAVQFLQGSGQSVFLPLVVPLPPLYNAQPFRPVPSPHPHPHPHPYPHPHPHPPKENAVAQSEVRPVPVSPPLLATPAPPGPSTSSFEIVQSHQVTDFVTSVEYPATFVQSHAIDLGGQQVNAEREAQPDISTVRYQLEDLSSGQLHQHLPASQLLTEIGQFAETTTQPPAADNYPAASSQQQLQQEQEQEQEQEQSFYYAEQFQEETSTLTYSTTTDLPITTTIAPPASPVIELNNHLAAVQHHRQGIGRGRETPKRLLDSPINHAPLTGAGAGGGVGGGRPFTRDPADLGFRLSQMYTPTQPPTPTSTYGAIDASGQFAGMAPPSPQQVIIPYTTKQRPRPFESWTPSRQLNHQQPQPNPQQNQNHYHNRNQNPHHGNDLEEEPHEQQESKLATATVTAPPLPPNSRRTTKYLTKILASNLRELLKRERETKRLLPGQGLGVDISRLQHNIDGWTEQEYNSLSHRPSTPTIRGRSKHIPSEYLTTTTTTTTTPSPTALRDHHQQQHHHQHHHSFQRQSKTTRGEGFELGAAPPTDAGDLSTSINNLEQLHLLGERGAKGFQPIEDNRLHFDYYDAQQRPRSTAAMTSSSTSTTTSTTTPPPSTTTAVAPLYVRSTPAPKELWKQAQVAILPQTNEKVYVVTPQPRHQEHHPVEQEQEQEQEHRVRDRDRHEASASAPRPVYQTPAPRFPRMRPTPGEVKSATPTSSSQLRNYTPDIFGLMGLSAFVPAEPVEIIDGNSKVNTIVTAAPTAAALQRPTAKPTMSPSPR
ncbi:histone-lysine N-methyltransferase 2D isoform X2 [Drosophila gunungcola]|uniref:histone-lysine N-methyltransferase 2D isoform X2 n=1 Tax=Drosophila gunungcola TaxID=103775 RepID=UPI0022E57C48|nr:histone-lysine N-methyltransferase 2D isoform X2 [Drosophila gunungcola]